MDTKNENLFTSAKTLSKDRVKCTRLINDRQAHVSLTCKQSKNTEGLLTCTFTPYSCLFGGARIKEEREKRSREMDNETLELVEVCI